MNYLGYQSSFIHLLPMGGGVSSPESGKKSRDPASGTIHWAAAWGPPARVEKLLENESIRNQLDTFHDGNTPLMVASVLGNAEICKLLIVAGACTDVLNTNGMSACDMAKDAKTREVFNSTARI